MADPGSITAAVAAKLLGITPSELDSLARENIIPRTGRDSYQVAPLVQGYLAYLRGETQRKKDRPTQQEMARLFDMSERAFRDLLPKIGVSDHKVASRDEITTAAIRYYREQAAGRLGATEGGLDPVQEGARKNKELADSKAMDNAIRRRELAPVSIMSTTLAEFASRIVPILDALPVRLRRECGLDAAALDVVTAEIAKARNEAADLHGVLIEQVKASLKSNGQRTAVDADDVR